MKGYGSFIKATLTFSESAIAECVIDASGETPSIGGVAAEEIAKLVMENQSADVVSSASAAITVPAVKKAVNNCIAQAMDLAAATVARYNELAQKGVDEDFLQRQLSGVLCRCGRRPHDDPGPLGCEGDFGKRVRTNGILNGIKKRALPVRRRSFPMRKVSGSVSNVSANPFDTPA